MRGWLPVTQGFVMALSTFKFQQSKFAWVISFNDASNAIVFHTVIVCDPRLCHGLELAIGKGHSAHMSKTLNTGLNVFLQKHKKCYFF